MRIWSVVSQKGGSGKTTLVLHAAVAAMGDAMAVSVIDLDPQRSAEQWSEHREAALQTAKPKKGATKHAADEPPVVYGTPQNLDGMLKAARQTGTDLVLIDTPPALDKHMIYAASCADMVIVPSRTSVLDQFALRETLDYLSRINAIAKAIVVINAPSKDAVATKQLESIAVRDFGVPLCAVSLGDDAAFAKALREGRGVTETAAKGKAGKAMGDLYRTLREFDRKLQGKVRS